MWCSMVEKVDLGLKQYNYNTVNRLNAVARNRVCENKAVSPSFCASSQVASSPAYNTNVNFRTELTTDKEKKQYKEILSKLDKTSKKNVELLLKNGILLNNNSDDKSTVLENLHKIMTEPRAQGLDNKILLKDTISTIAYPYLITQQFGDIPAKYRDFVVNINSASGLNNNSNPADVDVEHSGTCVAASTEFKLAKQMPAEFARFANELSSPKMSVEKTISCKELADNTLNSVWLLNAFEIPFEMSNYDNAKIKLAPDKNAIVRAQIQTTDKDPDERTPLDVLMQSTFMQVGSQQSYNTITDKRAGKFNQNDKGLIEFEKTFTESVVFGKNILSVTYQTVDENARLVGYETDFDTMKNHLTQAIDMGENVIIGYTQTNANNIIVNGHEITIVDYKKNPDGKITFICNDTDDGVSKPLEYSEDYLLPKIHHAALPKEVVETDMEMVPNWVEGINIYKQMKQHYSTAA